MTSPYLPTDDEIRAAYAQGEGAVIALFHRACTPGEHADKEAARSVRQGDLYWVATPESDIAHPAVIVQDDALNQSRLPTVVVCALTSNLQRVNLPGNLLLEAGEAGLPKASVVEVSKVSAVAKARLGAYIGALSPQRVQQILAGMRFLAALTNSD